MRNNSRVLVNRVVDQLRADGSLLVFYDGRFAVEVREVYDPLHSEHPFECIIGVQQEDNPSFASVGSIDWLSETWDSFESFDEASVWFDLQVKNIQSGDLL